MMVGKAVERAAAEEVAETEPLAESVAGVALAEEATTSGGMEAAGARSPVKLTVRLIRPGWGNKQDNHYYGTDMLRRDARVFEGAKMYTTDHRDSEKSVRTEVSVIDRIAGFDEDGAPLADVTAFEPNFAEMVRNRATAGRLDTLECSIKASGTVRPGFELGGRKGKVVEAITACDSVDWVTRAGAGGAALALQESAGGGGDAPETGGDRVTDKEHEELEGQQEEAEGQGGEQQPDPVAEAETEAAVLSEADVSAVLAEARLPEWAKGLIARGRYADADELKSAVQEAADELAEATRSGKPAQGSKREPARRKTLAEVEAAQDAVNARWLRTRAPEKAEQQ